MKLDQFLEGVFDLHCHVYPETGLEHEARLDDPGLIEAMRQAGMGGVILKSHLWPTVERAYYLQQRYPEVRIFSSLTMNRVSGGIDPLMVETAARQGAKALFFPTWQAANDLERGGFSRAIRERLPLYGGREIAGIRAADNGRLTPESEDALDVAKAFGLLVCTGHLSPAEGLLVIDGTRKRGLEAVFSHPGSPAVGASMDNMREATGMGAYVEFTCLYALSLRHHIPPRETVEIIQSLGADHCILTTDAFNAWVPPEPELMRLGIGQLLECGMSPEDVRRLTVHNPRKLLGLKAS